MTEAQLRRRRNHFDCVTGGAGASAHGTGAAGASRMPAFSSSETDDSMYESAFWGCGGPQPAPTAWDGLSSKDRLISSCRTVTKELSGKDFRDGSSHAQGLRRLYGFRFVRWRTGQTAQD